MALATTGEFESRHGHLEGDDKGVVGALLDDASALILGELAGTEAGWLEEDSEEKPPPLVKAVCIQVAYRAWQNPDSVAREELGEAARTYRGGREAEVLYLTKSELRMLRKAAGASSIQSIPVETPYSGDPIEGHPMDFFPIESEEP
jgi:hypothetical protein